MSSGDLSEGGEKFHGSFDNIRPEDREELVYILDFLDEYVWHYDEGPVWLTGSAQYDSDYGDIDLVVKRGHIDVAQSTGHHDYRVVHDMLAGLEDFDLGKKDSVRDDLVESDDVRISFYGQIDPPITRYRFTMNDTEFDLNFNPAPPNNGGEELIPSYYEKNRRGVEGYKFAVDL